METVDYNFYGWTKEELEQRQREVQQELARLALLHRRILEAKEHL